MRVNSYTILHYGKDYLGYALRSVYPAVERSFIFYTPHPSHGHAASVPPIETEEELRESSTSVIEQEQGYFAAVNYWMDKLDWRETDIWQEGQQRDYALSIASQNADLVLVLDYDEIWPIEVLDRVLAHVWNENKARNWLLNFSHLWRSFNWICRDDGWPVRVIDTRHSGGVAYIPKELGDVFHFGYAVTDAVMRYKWLLHGHKDELRPNWFEEKWQAWPPVDDCHPTNGRKENGEGWWNPKPFDKYLLPSILHSHKWFNEEIIK